MSAVYVWGKDTNGCLGQVPLDREAECPLPARVPGLPADAAAVACGESTTAVVTRSGELWCFGAAHPRLGLGELAEPQRIPRRVGGALEGRRVLQVSLGDAHALAVTSDGCCWAWGKGSHGCLGDGDAALRHARSTPALVRACADGPPLGPAKQVGAGSDLSVALLASGEMRTWGRNDHGQLGIGRVGGCAAWPQRVALPTLAEVSRCVGERAVSAAVAAAAAAADSAADVTDAAAANAAAAVDDATVVAIGCGSLYAGCVTASGAAYCWGYGSAGNLGCGGRRKAAARPVRVRLPPGERCTALACTAGQPNPPGGGADGLEGPHTLLVCASGALYTCGTHHKGLLGNLRRKALRCAHAADALTPYRVGGAAADDAGGGGEETGYLADVRCVQPLSAHIHNGVVDARGGLWTFGCGSNGRLGLRVYLQGLHGGKSRMKCYVMAPTRVELGGGGGVVAHAAASRRHMAAVVVAGREGGVGGGGESDASNFM